MIKGIISKCSQATAKTGSPYCSIVVTTTDGNKVNVNVWGSTSDQFPLWKSILITKEKSSDQGVSTSFDGVTISEPSKEELALIPHSISKQEWLVMVNKASSLMEDPDQSKFFQIQATRVFTPYSAMPAAKSNHHVYPGGLLDHTYQLLNMYLHVREALPFRTNVFIVCIACLFHDYIKLAEYDSKTYDYQPIMFLKGHVVGSAEVLGNLMRQEKFSSELILHCQHAILAHHGIKEWGSPVTPATPEAFVVHHLDMLSGHGVIYEDTPSNTRSFPLGTTVYHFDK